MNAASKSVFTIPAGVPFAKTLAEYIYKHWGKTPELLSDVTILLPTRRACRTLREAFSEIGIGKALILPRMQAIGDVNEEDLSLSLLANGEAFLDNRSE